MVAPAVAVLGFAALPGVASAAPHHNHGLTIAATPNPILTGERVLIYGQLNTAHHAHQTIVLYHRIKPSPFYTVVSMTKTRSTGFYEFTRAENIVLTNRNWYVTAPGLPGNVHSRTVRERVAAAVTLATAPVPATGFVTNQPITFTGAVAPDHAGGRVFLQEQVGPLGEIWKTIKRGRLDGASHFAITYRFRVPADHTVRVLFRRDARNIAGASESVTVPVQQKQVPGFTIGTSSPIIPVGSPATISGVLSMPGSTAPDKGVMVTLWGHEDGQPYAPVTTTTTAADGTYHFTVTPQHTAVYQVRTTFGPPRNSATLFEGVQDVVSIAASSMTSSVGESVTFTGAVSPDHRGHLIELERFGADGQYHVVKVAIVNLSSAYKFVWTFGAAGAKTFRVHISGGSENVSSSSPPVVIKVSLPAVQSLPPAS